jgi:hypothetical protein
MDAAPPISETTDPAEARAERHLAVLRELTEIGMGLARKVQHEAEQPTLSPPTPLPTPCHPGTGAARVRDP